ncbi:hypothetical protein QLX08_001529 [Tetragonisca angustula]|uniref:Uncharacterized protein n=1 Tax=Tetragonisca angustula TaxID=166442 RepID=A0AAW1AHK6_9HYME
MTRNISDETKFQTVAQVRYKGRDLFESTDRKMAKEKISKQNLGQPKAKETFVLVDRITEPRSNLMTDSASETRYSPRY